MTSRLATDSALGSSPVGRGAYSGAYAFAEQSDSARLSSLEVTVNDSFRAIGVGRVEFAKPLYGLTPVPRVRIPPSPPDSLDCRDFPRQFSPQAIFWKQKLRTNVPWAQAG